MGKTKLSVILGVIILLLIASAVFVYFDRKTGSYPVISGGGFTIELKPGMVSVAPYDIPSETKKQFEETRWAAEEAVQKEANFSNWLDLAVARHSLGDLWGAAEAYLRAYEAGSDSSLALDNLSQVLIEMKDYEMADKVLQQGIKNVPGNDLLYAHLADLYKNYLEKSNEEIEKVYLDGFAATKNVNLALSLANFYEEIGNRAKADDLRNRIQKELDNPSEPRVEYSE